MIDAGDTAEFVSGAVVYDAEPGPRRQTDERPSAQGRPRRGQFAHTVHGHPAVGLRGDVHVHKEAATYFSDQIDSIQREDLKGALSAHDGKLKFTFNDGRSFAFLWLPYWSWIRPSQWS